MRQVFVDKLGRRHIREVIEMKIKVYRLLAQPEIPSIRRFGGNTWENPTQVTIVSTSITDVHHVDKESAVIVSNGCRYMISREDFDKIFEVEVL